MSSTLHLIATHGVNARHDNLPAPINPASARQSRGRWDHRKRGESSRQALRASLSLAFAFPSIVARRPAQSLAAALRQPFTVFDEAQPFFQRQRILIMVAHDWENAYPNRIPRAHGVPMPTTDAIQLGDFCKRLQCADREVRYILERGLVPPGVAVSPSTGNPRHFDFAQAFWLAVVIKLKQAGIKTSIAAVAADRIVRGLQSVTRGLGWDGRFLPKEGELETDHQYFFDIADAKHGRLVTDAEPSKKGLVELPWFPLQADTKVRSLKVLEPILFIRIDLSQIARLVSGDPAGQ